MASSGGNDPRMDGRLQRTELDAPAHVAAPSLLGFAVIGADGRSLGNVALDLRAAYPRNRLVIEYGTWLWRRRYVVARAHVVDADVAARLIRIDLDRTALLAMPRWDA